MSPDPGPQWNRAARFKLFVNEIARTTRKEHAQGKEPKQKISTGRGKPC
ncbi:hypothetical protein FTUN_2968 [Frigoriglobus tundricola]|uniref:Uncharacterized protein n=1 Tax=Frigoriglobus tundricola TaxID=2774151 RepID=A0A6M5YMT5_9BACT|nr:hypothetical protein FTUN_2968 [Frigoriglobus tundricola]